MQLAYIYAHIYLLSRGGGGYILNLGGGDGQGGISGGLAGGDGAGVVVVADEAVLDAGIDVSQEPENPGGAD